MRSLASIAVVALAIAVVSCADGPADPAAPDDPLLGNEAPTIVVTCAFPAGTAGPELVQLPVILPDQRERLQSYRTECMNKGGHLVTGVGLGHKPKEALSAALAHPTGRPNVWTGRLPQYCPDNVWPVVDARGNTWQNWCYAALEGVRVTWDLWVEPSISTVLPSSGFVGTEVTVTGAHFVQEGLPTHLTIGGREADLFVTGLSADEITFLAPNAGAAGVYPLCIQAGVGQACADWEQLLGHEPSEPDNDDPATAPSVQLPLDLVGSFLEGDVNDFLGFTLDAPATLQITLDWDHAPQDLDLLVFDGDLNWGQCDFQAATGWKPETAECSLPAGQYFLWVNDWTTLQGNPPTLVNYRLTVDVS